MTLALLLALASSAPPREAAFVETRVEVPMAGTWLALRDMDGDGRSDLVSIDGRGVDVKFMREDGRYPARTDASLAWPARDLGWDFADVDADGASELVVIEDSRRVRAWRASRAEGFDEGRDVLAKVDAHLPRGRRHVRFVRDVNGDGRADVVVPSSAQYLIYLGSEGGEWSKPLQVRFEANIEYEIGDPARIDETFGISVRIPWFSLEDLDGDGLTDLVSETDDQVQFHLASPDLPPDPTWRLDKAGLKEATGSFEIDFDDLFAVLGRRVDWRIADLDGEGPADLIVQQGSTFRVYRDGSRKGNAGTPDDLLKSSGHVLAFLLSDLDGDGLTELLMVRADDVSLGRVVRWLVLPGSLDFDVFAYRNEGGTFSKKPISRVAISLRIPRLLTFFEDLEAMSEEVDASLALPTTLAVLDADGARNDVVDVLGGEVVLFRDCAPENLGIDWRNLDELDFEGMIEAFLLEQIEDLDDGGVATIDLGELENIDISPAEELRSACAGRKPALKHPLAFPESPIAIDVIDIDGDGTSDVIAYQEDPDRKVRVLQFLVTR
jgi:hypothetical protein